jgi:hypothetical protein
LLLLAFVVACASGCAEQQAVTHLYDGPPRPPAEVAIVHNANDVFVRLVDGRAVDNDQPGDRTKRIFHLPPGEHRLEVEYHDVEKDLVGVVMAWRRSYNLFTLRHDFEVGRVYRLEVLFESREGREIVIPVLMNDVNQQVARPDTSRRPPVVPEGATGATLAGIAIAQESDAGGLNPRVITATGREVYLIEDSPATREWLGQLRETGQFNERYIRSSAPEAARSSIRLARGYGVGYFEFQDVPASDYIIFFRTSWNVAKVRPGQRLVDNIEVTPDGPSELAEPEREKV